MTVTMAGVMMLMTVSGYGSGVLDKPVAAALAIFFGGIVSVIALNGQSNRLQPVISGAIGGAAAALVLSAVQAFSGVDFKTIAIDSGWMFAGCLLSGIIATGLLPLFERVFDISTEARLNELMNNNNPLLKRLMLEAPGTYHHSVIVGNLSEAAASSIGANPFLARAGAYYHDIGKLKRPGYFKENQMGENPHENVDPYVSAAILTSHTKDGMLMAQKEHLPPEIQQIILQHHGVTPVMFFYHKALQMSDGQQVDINDFRYAGPRPQTKEAAIVMLADTIEAAVRSMKDPTPKGIDQFIERLIRGKLEDGQLIDCPLSLSDIDKISDAFTSILRGVYHERIEYPTVQKTLLQQVSEHASGSAENEYPSSGREGGDSR